MYKLTKHFLLGNLQKYGNNNKLYHKSTVIHHVYCLRNLYNKSSKTIKGNVEEYKVGLTRHFSPANKEWKDSVYSYDKNYLRTIPFKYNDTDRLVKGNFNIHGRKDIGRSRRARSRRIRHSSKKVYVSKPEIKQNNDKVIITVYVFDRERQFFIRKLFFSWRKPTLYNSWLINNFERKVNIKKRYDKIYYLRLRRKHMFRIRARRKVVRGNVPLYGIKLSNQLDFLRYKTLNFFKRFFLLDKLLLYLFMCYFLSLFEIKVLIPSDINGNKLAQILKKKPKILLTLNGKNNALNIIKKDDITDKLIENIDSYPKHMETPELERLPINHLWEFIENRFIKTGTVSHIDIHNTYKIFMRENYKKIMHNLYRNHAKLLYNYTRMEINKMKYTKFIPILKSLVSRIYDKTTELNIVNLKYIYLHGDLFTQAIASKLRRKKGLLKILGMAFKLVKMPLKFNFINSITDLSNFNKYQSLNTNKLPIINTKDNLNEDKLNKIIKEFYSNDVTHKTNLIDKSRLSGDRTRWINDKQLTINKVNRILNYIKFKWVAGIRLEAAGRLTRRNTASRAVFKYKYKGNLKNKQYYLENGLLKPMSVVMLRKYESVNTQYTFRKSKRRIGSFGLKSWISGY